MGKVRSVRAVLTGGACLLLAATGVFSGHTSPALADNHALGTSGSSLFAQSAGQILTRAFPSENISYLLMDANSGQLLASRWPRANQPIPLGSLVKPFAALAYAEWHDYQYPILVCHGTESGCWQPRPHGRLNISSALAYSCNSYFRELTSRLTGAQMRDVALQFGLDPPESQLSGPPLMGLGSQWQVSPLGLARAYVELIHRRDEPGVREILAGLEDSARWGTGSGAGQVLKPKNILVKTGTAVCQHMPRGPGDGFAVLVAPGNHPELLLMVRVHGVTGSRAAFTAAQMLLQLEQ